MMKVTKERFEAAVVLTLTSAFSLRGTWVISKTKMVIDGTVLWNSDKGSPAFQASGQVTFSRKGFALTSSGELFAIAAQLNVEVAGKTAPSLLTATVALQVPEELQAAFRGKITEAAQGAKQKSIELKVK